MKDKIVLEGTGGEVEAALPEWLDTPPEATYILTMFAHDDVREQEIPMSREEFIALKHQLAGMRARAADHVWALKNEAAALERQGAVPVVSEFPLTMEMPLQSTDRLPHPGRHPHPPHPPPKNTVSPYPRRWLEKHPVSQTKKLLAGATSGAV